MVCDGITTLECSVLLTSQQDVKLMFILIYYAAFIFVWYFFTQKRIDNIKVQYYAWPVLISKWSGFLYFLFTPVHILLFQSSVSQELALGWFALFYIPTVTVSLLMPLLMIFDRLFRLFGYNNTFDFVKRYRERLI